MICDEIGKNGELAWEDVLYYEPIILVLQHKIESSDSETNICNNCRL